MAVEEDDRLDRPSQAQGPTKSWAELCSEYGGAAADALLNKPPAEKSTGFLRRCSVLATLCNYVYSYKESYVGSKSYIPVHLDGIQGDTAPVAATLLHFREAVDNGEVSGPQQFGIWLITAHDRSHAEAFVVVAFRGTSSLEDVIVDANIAPHTLSSDGQTSMSIHRGFYSGATEHVDDIVKVLRQADQSEGTILPVWVTGHSLGGAYANALILHLLHSRRTKDLFKEGGGSCTFGAPMVLHSPDSGRLYQELVGLEPSIGMDQGSMLSFHNFVNNADPVPRLLGGSLDAVHGYLESKLPRIKNVRRTANEYHPFGHYHLVIGSEVRSLRMPEAQPGVSSCLGNAVYAARVKEQLDLRYMWRLLYGTTGKGAGWTPHNMTSYQERLSTYIENLIHRQSQSSRIPIEPQVSGSASLFAPADRECPASMASNAASSEFSAGMRTLLQAGALRAGKAAYSWWNSTPETCATEESAVLETEYGRNRVTNATQGSANARPAADQGKVEASTSSSKWLQKSRWTYNKEDSKK